MRARDFKIALLMMAALISSCAPALRGDVAYSDDDLYATHNRETIKADQVQKAYNRQMLMENRMEQWAQILGIEVDVLARRDESYNTPYGEKLRALAGDEYELPASYYEYKYQAALEELSEYDPYYYTAEFDIDGDIRISPKYISAIYGVWNAYGYRDYSWSYGYPHWNHYWTWGYPYNSWMSWNYSFGYYNPWWGDYPYYFVPGVGYIYGNDYLYYGFGYSSWYSPFHRPIFYMGGIGGGGVSSKRSLIVRQASAYQSPSSSIYRNADGSTVGRSSVYNPTGSQSQSTYNRSTTYNSTTTYSSPSRTTSTPASTTPVKTNSIGR
ncbi:MAG: hypothetical protein R3Y16_01950 [Rikenellaceae bacterium]